MLKSKSFFSMMLAFCILFTSIASAQASQKLDEEVIKNSATQDDNNYSKITYGYTEDKETYIQLEEEKEANIRLEKEKNNDVVPLWGTWVLDDIDSTRYKGAYLTASLFTEIFASRLQYCDLSGRTMVVWGGDEPPTADRLKHVDEIKFTGINLSIGKGGNFSSGGNSLVYDSGWKTGAWRASHNYDGIRVYGLELFVSQTTTGMFEFNDSVYTVQASDFTWV